MTKWHTICEDLFKENEAAIHPHCAEERAELFTSANNGSLELETADFLHAAIRLFKPMNVLETGTYKGISALAIACGLFENGMNGKLITIDATEQPEAINLFNKYGVTNNVDFVKSNSIAFIALLDELKTKPFDFLFFDSDISCRHKEFRYFLAKNLIAPNAIVCFHDTSRTRGKSSPDFNPEYIAKLDELVNTNCIAGMENPLSRGFRMGQVKC